MNYERIYNEFIADRKAKEPVGLRGLTYGSKVNSRRINKRKYGYMEVHHIVPKSKGGDNTAKNVVALTARDHFFAHRLLAKFDSSQYLALRLMINPKSQAAKGYQPNITSRAFSTIREQAAKISGSYHVGEKNCMKKPEQRARAKAVTLGHIKNGTGPASEEAKARSKEVRKCPEYRKRMIEVTSGENNAMFGMTGGKNPNSCEVRCIETGVVFSSVAEAKHFCGGDVTKAIRTGGKAGGYTWERVGAAKLEGRTTREYRENANGILITYKGETKTFKNMCKHVGVSDVRIRELANLKGISYQDAFGIVAEETKGFTTLNKPNRGRNVLNLDTGEIYNNATAASDAIGISISTLTNHIAGRTKTAAGFKWSYV